MDKRRLLRIRTTKAMKTKRKQKRWQKSIAHPTTGRKFLCCDIIQR